MRIRSTVAATTGEDDYQKSLGCGMCIEITANGEQTSPSTGGPTPIKGTYKAYVGDWCGACKQGGLTVIVILNTMAYQFKCHNSKAFEKTSSAYVHLITLKGTIRNISMRIQTYTNDWICLKMNTAPQEHSDFLESTRFIRMH